jgi:hypothetical protein
MAFVYARFQIEREVYIKHPYNIIYLAKNCVEYNSWCIQLYVLWIDFKYSMKILFA